MPFYADGLRFTCARCSRCCRLEPGFVFLSEKDALGIAASLGMRPHEFAQAYCRQIEMQDGTRLALKEKSNYDCVFWDGGCKIYETRPVQCRTYPFWPSSLASREAWARTAAECAGAGRGTLRNRAYIDSLMEMERSNPLITRKNAL